MENEAHIYIYGVIDSRQDSEASEWGYVNLTSVKKQLENQKDYDSITVHIHSGGGVVTEGFAIHDFIRSQGKPVTTVIDGVCASIATVVLLAGDTRIGTENSKPFIHNPWGMAGGDKDEMRKYADELETMENDIAEFYASKTKLSKEEALQFMKDETAFTSEECLTNGFLTEINSVMRAVALFKPTKNKKKMSKEKLTKEEAEGMFTEMLNKITKILKPKKKKAMNKIITDADGVEILFPDVEDDAQEAVGDKATVDGSAAEGDILMPDGSTYKFESGVLMEIVPAVDGSADPDVEALQLEIETLKGEIATLKENKKDLKAEAKLNKKESKKVQKEVEAIKETMEDLKKNFGSRSIYKGKKNNFKKADDGARSVWKSTEE